MKTTIYVSFRRTDSELRYLGQINFQELISRNSDYLFERNRDRKGRYCTPYLADGSGDVVCEEYEGSTGRLVFDGEYNTEYTITLECCDYSEIKAILRAEGFKGLDVEEAISAGEITLD